MSTNIGIDLEMLQKPLSIDEIDFRIQSINKGGYATILAYKDARADINRLNQSCGVLGWQRSHSRDNKNCTVSIWNSSTSQWVSKEDTGTESMAEAQKGLASDSFKRACFNLGIGIELYDYPQISIQLIKGVEWQMVGDKPKQMFGLKLKEWTWKSNFKDGKITSLSATDNNGNNRFSWELGRSSKPKPAPTAPVKELPWLNEGSDAWKRIEHQLSIDPNKVTINGIKSKNRLSKSNEEKLIGLLEKYTML